MMYQALCAALLKCLVVVTHLAKTLTTKYRVSKLELWIRVLGQKDDSKLMAAIAAPLIIAALPILKPYITMLITHAEHLFGDKTGVTKFDNVLQATVKTAADLSTAGKLPGTLDPSSIAMMIETEVQNLKNTGVLTPAAASEIVKTTSTNINTATPTTVKVTGTLTLS